MVRETPVAANEAAVHSAPPGRETPGRETPAREAPGRETPGRGVPPDPERRRRGRSIAILIALLGLCALFYAITIVKMAHY